MTTTVLIDCSYFCYFNIFSAFSRWIKTDKSIIQNKDLNPTKDSNFIELLNERIVDRFENIFFTIKKKFDIDVIGEKIPVLFAIDCSHKNIWRNTKFQGYKLSRKIVEKPFNIGACFEYLFSTTFCMPQIVENYNLVRIKVENAEGDDIIGAIVRNVHSDLNIIVASDHDFLQLKNEKTHILNLFGDSITFEHYYKIKEITTWQDFLLLKILMGDNADCLPHVFPGKGIKTCLGLIKDKDKLKQLLRENTEALNQFKLNSELMDFTKIPTEIQTNIITEYSNKLKAFYEKAI
jgi:5'-3' exonuclease